MTVPAGQFIDTIRLGGSFRMNQFAFRSMLKREAYPDPRPTS